MVVVVANMVVVKEIVEFIDGEVITVLNFGNAVVVADEITVVGDGNDGANGQFAADALHVRELSLLHEQRLPVAW